jgi:hypothetical protein
MLICLHQLLQQAHRKEVALRVVLALPFIDKQSNSLLKLLALKQHFIKLEKLTEPKSEVGSGLRFQAFDYLFELFGGKWHRLIVDFRVKALLKEFKCFVALALRFFICYSVDGLGQSCQGHLL